MKKALLFSLTLSLLAIPLAVNAATTKVSETASLQYSKFQILAGFGFIEDMKDTVDGVNELVTDTEEDSGSINDGVGNLKTKFSGGENSESDEVIEEDMVEEGTEAEASEDSEDSKAFF